MCEAAVPRGKACAPRSCCCAVRWRGAWPVARCWAAGALTAVSMYLKREPPLSMIYRNVDVMLQLISTATCLPAPARPGAHPWALLRSGTLEGALALAAAALAAAPAAGDPARLPGRVYVALALYVVAVLASAPLKGALAAYDPAARAQARSQAPSRLLSLRLF
jgi:hypothetical protein